MRATQKNHLKVPSSLTMMSSRISSHLIERPMDSRHYRGVAQEVHTLKGGRIATVALQPGIARAGKKALSHQRTFHLLQSSNGTPMADRDQLGRLKEAADKPETEISIVDQGRPARGRRDP